MNLEWTPCSQPPSDSRRVLVWHRVRPFCRRNEIVVGWWNSEEWRRDWPWIAPGERDHGRIYQPKFWKDVETPK